MNLFAYLDINNPMVAWEVAIGRMKSAGYDYNDEIFELSIWEYDLIKNYTRYGATQKLINELQLEYIRKLKYNHCVSRMKCLYFFETRNETIFALDHWGIDVDERYISEVNVNISSITKVDSEWITNFLESKENDWMDNYWQGKNYNNKPLYELLVNGFGIIMNERLCREAYKKVYDTFPYSTCLLAWAMCGFQIKNIDSIAKIVPGISARDGKIKGSYFIDITDIKKYEKEIIKAIDYVQSLNDFPPIVLPPPELNAAFILPDFRYLEIDFENSYIATLLQKVHKNN
jgi:hypothetical protein